MFWIIFVHSFSALLLYSNALTLSIARQLSLKWQCHEGSEVNWWQGRHWAPFTPRDSQPRTGWGFEGERRSCPLNPMFSTQFCLHNPIGTQGSLLRFKLVHDERKGIAAIMTYCIISTKLRRDHMVQIWKQESSQKSYCNRYTETERGSSGGQKAHKWNTK